MTHDSVPCPHCGGEIRADATFCRHCGSSEADGWQEDFNEGLDEDDFDYEAYVAEHHGSGVTNTAIAPIWRFVAIALLLLFLGWVFFIF